MSPSASPASLTVLWRGALSSCNYGCPYCPFAKTNDTKATLEKDRAALERFCGWAMSRPYPVSILFTPWGEALIRNYYRDAMERLSNAGNIETVAVQTNLSCSVEWISACDLDSSAFWCTFHPGETDRASFLSKIRRLDEMGVRYSVGIVGLREHLDDIEGLRRDMPPAGYLWVNAYRREPDYYEPRDIERICAVDPLFELNNRSYASLSRPCHGGETVVSVLADGTARRCHFIQTPIGNIYDADFEECLAPRPCPAESCRCHIGYSHLKELDLRALFGRGFLERRPESVPARHAVSGRIADFDAQVSTLGR